MNITKQEIAEAYIIAALFRATSEQTNFFNQRFSGKPKKEFKNWQNKGEKVIANLGIEQDKVINELTESIENVVHEFRKQLINQL
jgi:hypothetical protein